MTDFILRNVDTALWKRVKERAKREGFSLRVIILRLLALYARGLDLDEPSVRKRR